MITDNIQGLVLYTDGSCGQGKRTGIGIHGYSYRSEKEKKRRYNYPAGHITSAKGYWHRNDDLQLGNTDTDFLNHEVYPIEYIDVVGSYQLSTSATGAEIDALANALSIINQYKDCVAVIYSDNESVVNVYNQSLRDYSDNGWKKKDNSDVPNKNNWKRVMDQVVKLSDNSIKVYVKWVKGHSVDISPSANQVANAHAIGIGNAHADVLARIGMLQWSSVEDIVDVTYTESDIYWKKTVDKHPLIMFKKVFISNFYQDGLSENKLYVAETGGEDSLLWNKSPDNGYGIIVLNEVDPVIKEVLAAYQDKIGVSDMISVLRVDNCFSANIYKYLLAYGRKSLYVPPKREKDLDFVVEKIPIVTEINPPGLTFRSIEIFHDLERWLKAFSHIAYEQTSTYTDQAELHGLKIHDITDTFFMVQPDKKGREVMQLNKQIAQGMSNIKIQVKVNDTLTINPIIVFGTNIPTRNSLKHLESESPKVYLLTWFVTASIIRFAIVINTDLGYGIFSNYFSDVLVV